jgi:hypothetical protein
LAGDNLYIWKVTGSRQCRTCSTVYKRNYERRMRKS